MFHVEHYAGVIVRIVIYVLAECGGILGEGWDCKLLIMLGVGFEGRLVDGRTFVLPQGRSSLSATGGWGSVMVRAGRLW